MRATFLFIATILGFFAAAQTEYLYTDNTYLDNLKTVRFHIDGVETSMPMIDLGKGGMLMLEFDDMDADVKNYVYTLVHCDADWKPSQMSELEYMSGFTEDRIRDMVSSTSTLVPFTHYEITLPNENIRWTKSGNYLLVVYEDEDERRVAITRRMMIVESVVVFYPQIQRPVAIDKMRTHQELDFTINHKGFKINNPKIEVKACLLQNNRWDNARMLVAPTYFRTEELIFDYQDSLTFPAGLEFRWADLRSTQYVSRRVKEIYREDGEWYLILHTDRDRYDQSYAYTKDLNGQYIIQNAHESDAQLDADYIHALFTLDCPEKVEGADVYLFGAFSEWQCKPQFKMTYNEVIGGYTCDAFVKQGFYDYQYKVVPKKGFTTEKTFEYNWHETENEYLILLYYRPFGGNYDRLIGAHTLSSFRK